MISFNLSAGSLSTTIEERIVVWFTTIPGIGRYQTYDNALQFHSIEPESISKVLSLMDDAGSFTDINYHDTGRSRWEPVFHINRIAQLTAAWHQTDEPELKSNLASAVTRGLHYFHDRVPPCRNWWYNRIPVPEKALLVAIAGKPFLSQKSINKAVRLGRGALGTDMTGQNRLWLMTNRMLLGTVLEDEDLIREAAALIGGELKLGTGEGIQTDYSFHQHGPLFHQGNYGRHFLHTAAFAARILEGSSAQYSADHKRVLVDLILEGTAWMIWNGRLDYIARGRQIAYSSRGQGPDLTAALDQLLACEVPRRGELEQLRSRIASRSDSEPGAGGPRGTRWFPRSGYLVTRRPGWSASSKISSRKWVSTERTNSENLKGYYLSDGLLTVRKTGEEFHGIFPLWDWSALPGITAPAGPTPSIPYPYYGKSRNTFGLSEGKNGLTAMDYRSKKVSGHKATFIIGDAIILLGAEIKGRGKSQIRTAFSQQWADAGGFQRRILGNHLEVDHGASRWIFPARREPEITALIEQREGSWHQLRKAEEMMSFTGEVFALYETHRSNDNYEAILYPELTAAPDLSSAAGREELPIVLANSGRIQAVRSGSLLAAVFYTPGTLNASKIRLTAQKPSAVLIDLETGEMTLSQGAKVSVRRESAETAPGR